MNNALSVVAHHDDHVLWMGGSILRMRSLGWNWTLLAMCVPDKEKQRYFSEFCAAFGVTCSFLKFEDYQGGHPFCRNSREQMKTELMSICSGTMFDFVFTHSRHEHREYGHHANHAEVEQVVTELVHDESIGRGTNHLAYFCYRWNGVGGTPTTASQEATHYLQPNYEELIRKAEWCKRVPDIGSLRNLAFPCPSPEAFEGDNLTLPFGNGIEGFKRR